MRILVLVLLSALAASPADAGNWQEFKRAVRDARACVARHPGQLPKLEAHMQKYQHRMAEADAIAMANPALADMLIAKPLRQLREDLAQCVALDGGRGRSTRRRW